MPRDYQVLPGVPWSTLAVISAGGVIGALARYWLIVAFPEPGGAFVWPVFWINVTGSLLIGVVVVLATEIRRISRLFRPFLATGVLGGFTTFSTYVSGMQHQLAAGSPRTALAYGAATVIGALAAAWCGVRMTTAMVGVARRVSSGVVTADGPPSPDQDRSRGRGRGDGQTMLPADPDVEPAGGESR